MPSGRPSSVVPAAYAAGVMSDCALNTDTRYGKLPFAPSSVNSTVVGSTALVEPFSITPPRPALPASTRRSIVATTSSAVKSPPFCHLTPLRSLNVQTVLSSLGVHSVARPGPMSLVAGSRATRNSNDWARRPYADRSCIAIGSSVAAGRWTATRIVPPVWPGEAAAPPLGEAPGLPAGGATEAAGGVSQAMRIAEIEAMLRPTIVPRLMNSRRDRRPRAKASTTSSCGGVVDRRTRS